MAPVIVALQREPQRFVTQVVATAQHREMLDHVLDVFGITPDVDLNLMRAGQQLGDLTAKLVVELETLWQQRRPDLVLVQGDTTSSFAAALVAYYRKITLGHVEAGLRSGRKYAPFPEEMNRRLVGALADMHFAPTERARQHLLAEGVADRQITVTGNTGVDALLLTLERIRTTGFIPSEPCLASLDGRPMILVTAHRRESFGEGLQNICEALRTITRVRPDATLIYPVHPNPSVAGPVRERLDGIANIHLTAPLDYPTFVYAMARADLILTDSGGVQEEAPSLGKPVLVMREVTERTEAVDLGVAELVGTSPDRIVSRTLDLLNQPPASRPSTNPFGDGRAGERIVRTIAERLA